VSGRVRGRAMKKRLDHCLTSVFLFLLVSFLFLAAENRFAYATYNVTIDALDYKLGGVAVLVSLDGENAVFTTPHTFTGLSGIHTFSVPNADIYLTPFDNWNYSRWMETTLTISSGGTYIAYYIGPAPYAVTIIAWEQTRGYLESVPITMENTIIGNTPYLFENLSGTHSFTVPNTDSFGVPFGKWSNDLANPTLTVSSGGVFTAEYYYPPFNVTISGWDSVYGGASEPITFDGAFAGFTPQTFTDLTGLHNFTLPSTNNYGHQFTGWNTGETSTTISIIQNGTYTAMYTAPEPSSSPTPSPTPTATPSPTSTPTPVPTSISPTPKPTSSSIPTPKPTKTANPTTSSPSTLGPTEAARFAFPQEAFYVIVVIAVVAVAATAMLAFRKKKQKGESKIV
jgi:hypothetical protein